MRCSKSNTFLYKQIIKLHNLLIALPVALSVFLNGLSGLLQVCLENIGSLFRMLSDSEQKNCLIFLRFDYFAVFQYHYANDTRSLSLKY